jgi:methyl-accepting chemotaxis protein
VVAGIEEVNAVILRMNGTATAVATAMEGQGSATQEIARNVQQVSQGASEISANISVVTAAANETGVVATSVLKAAGELSTQASSLQQHMVGIVSGIRAN